MSGTQGRTGFVARQLEIRFEFGQGKYGEQFTTSDTFTVRNARISALVNRTGYPGYSTADIRVWGLSLASMNRLTTLGKPMELYTRNNRVTLSAGDATNGMAVVYSGIIQEAWSGFEEIPDVPLLITSHSGAIEQMKQADPTSYSGAVDVATVLSDIAKRMGYTLEANGVSGVMLHDPYFPGTLRDQAEAAARAAHVNLFFDDTEKKLAIWPQDGSRNSLDIVELPPSARLGWPGYASAGAITLRTLFNPSLRFGQRIKVTSNIASANGTFVINGLTHALDALIPHGKWFTEIGAYLDGFPVVPQ